MTEDTRSRLVVTADLPCRRCRYPLRGHEISGRCPECGLPIEETLRSSIDLASLGPVASPSVSPARLLLGSSMLAFAVAVATLAGILMPLALVSAPAGFDPAGADDAAITARLTPIVFWIGVAAAIAGTLGLGGRAILGPAITDQRFKRSIPVAVFILAAVATSGLLPNVLGLWSAADTATRGLGSLFDEGWRGPQPVVLVTLAVEIGRALATSFLVIGLSALLDGIGSRSELYARAGQGRQGLIPFLASTAVVITASVGWLGLALTSVSGSIHRTLAAVPWDLTWMVGASVAALGGGYLVANLAWALSPWRRAHTRLDSLVGPVKPATPTTTPRSAGMADDAPDEPSA